MVSCYAQSNGVSLLQTQWSCVLWFSALNNALNRISEDTLWFISACLPSHIAEFSWQASAVLNQGKHLLPSGRCANHTMSWETVVGWAAWLWAVRQELRQIPAHALAFWHCPPTSRTQGKAARFGAPIGAPNLAWDSKWLPFALLLKIMCIGAGKNWCELVRTVYDRRGLLDEDVPTCSAFLWGPAMNNGNRDDYILSVDNLTRKLSFTATWQSLETG